MLKILLIIILITTFSCSQADIIYVTKTGDTRVGNDGGCDLREAISSANFNVLFDGCSALSSPGTDFILINIPGPIQLEAEIDVFTAISISPPIGNNVKVKIIAANNERVFKVFASANNTNEFQMINLHLEGGNAGLGKGGAIWFQNSGAHSFGDIYIGDSIFESNTAAFGGAISFDQSQANSVTIKDNVFLDNQAQAGGAISADRATTGAFEILSNKFESNDAINMGGVITAGAAFLIDSNNSSYLIQKNQFIANTSAGSAGALDVRGYNANQDFAIDNNVFFDNQAVGIGGGLFVGALAQAVLYNSTLANNTGSKGGGVVIFDGRLDIRSSTIVYNTATGSGENIYVYNAALGNISRSIVAYAGQGSNCAGSFNGISTGASNVMDDRSCPFDNISDIEADPMLSAKDNHVSGFYGFTPLVNSPAIDTHEENFCRNYDNSFMTEDQQGSPRPVDSDSNGTVYCDSGAIEAPLYTNQAAVANDDTPSAILEDSNSVIIDVLSNDSDADGDSFIVINKTNGGNGSVVIQNSGQNVSYKPNLNYCGTDTFTYTITGGDTATVTIDITCVDDLPVATNDSIQVNEDSNQITIQVLNNDTDVDNGPKTIEIITQPGHGTTINNNNSISYQPNANYCNENAVADAFNYTLNGGSMATVTLQVSCVDDLPIAVTDNYQVDEDSGQNILQVLMNDTDVDNGSINIAMITQASHGTVINQNNLLRYVPDENYCNSNEATDDFTYTLNGGSSTSVSVTVNCIDDAPIAVSDSITIQEDASTTVIQVLVNDTDVDGGVKTIDSVTQPANGTVINNKSTLSYLPDENYCNDNSSSDNFTYTLNGNSGTTVSVFVSCMNDQPVAVADSVTINEDSTEFEINVLDNDTDVDQGEYFVNAISQPLNGIVTNHNTHITYKPIANYCNQGNTSDDFTYELNGGSTTTVSVEVRCVNDQPSYVIFGDIVADHDLLNQSQLVVANFADTIVLGPNNESSQQIAQFETIIHADDSNVIQDININNNGDLTINFTENPGVVIIHSRLQDNGGVANGGNDTSETTVFYVTFSDEIYSNGFEEPCCLRVENYIYNIEQSNLVKHPGTIIPSYDYLNHSIEYYGYVLELTQAFPKNIELHQVKQWLEHIRNLVDPESMIKF